MGSVVSYHYYYCSSVAISSLQSAEARLIKSIRDNSSQEVRPVTAANHSIQLQFSMVFNNIIRVNEKEQVISVQANLKHVCRKYK